jgi:hypothetical protein
MTIGRLRYKVSVRTLITWSLPTGLHGCVRSTMGEDGCESKSKSKIKSQEVEPINTFKSRPMVLAFLLLTKIDFKCENISREY